MAWRLLYHDICALSGCRIDISNAQQLQARSSSVLAGISSFIVLCIWQAISPISEHGWANWFLIHSVIVPGITAVVSAVWFSIDGTIDDVYSRIKERWISLLRRIFSINI